MFTPSCIWKGSVVSYKHKLVLHQLKSHECNWGQKIPWLFVFPYTYETVASWLVITLIVSIVLLQVIFMFFWGTHSITQPSKWEITTKSITLFHYTIFLLKLHKNNHQDLSSTYFSWWHIMQPKKLQSPHYMKCADGTKYKP